MAALYKALLRTFVNTDANSLVGILAQNTATRTIGVVTHLQIGAWTSQINDLQLGLRELIELEETAAEWGILLEYSIPVIGRRPDAVILAAGHVFVIEYKAGSTESAGSAFEQALGYACDLRDFHEKSRNRHIVPFAMGTMAKGVSRYDSMNGGVVTAAELARKIIDTMAKLGPSGSPVSLEEWDCSRYFAVPTLVEAASAIFDEHDVREISHSKAGSDNLSSTLEAILLSVQGAMLTEDKILCLLTGVPGAGKP